MSLNGQEHRAIAREKKLCVFFVQNVNRWGEENSGANQYHRIQTQTHTHTTYSQIKGRE